MQTERDDLPNGDLWWLDPTPPSWVLTCAGYGHSAKGRRCGCGGLPETDHGLNSITMTCTRCDHRYRAAWD